MLLFPSWYPIVTPETWFASLPREKMRQNEVRKGVRDSIHSSWMNVLRIHGDTHTHTYIVAHSHVYPSVVFPFFLSIWHSSIPSHFFQSHEPSHMLSHTGSSLGRALSCCLLGCNNYSISWQCVSWFCSWAVAAGGMTVERGVLRRGGGLVVTLGRRVREVCGVGGSAHPVLSRGAQSRSNELKLAY